MPGQNMGGVWYQALGKIKINRSLRVNETLKRGQRLTSANSEYYAVMQEDNNFVVYRSSDNHALWATNTHMNIQG